MAASLIGTGSASGTTVTIPSHQAGDLLLIAAFRDGSNTVPSIPSGWTQEGSAAGSSCSMIVGNKTAASSSDTSGSWANATELICMVYRGSSGHGLDVGIAGASFSSGTSNTVSFFVPSVTGGDLDNTDGSSIVAAALGHRSTDQNLSAHTPSGMVNQVDVLDVTAELAGYDTNGGVTSLSNKTVTLSGTASGWISMMIEIKEIATIVNNVALSISSSATVSLRNAAAKLLSSLGAISLAISKGVARRLSLSAAGTIITTRQAQKGLTTTSSSSVAQILRQWVKSFAVMAPASVSMGPRQTGKVPIIGAGSVIQRLSAIASARGISSSGAVSLSRGVSKSLAVVGNCVVATARWIGKALSLSSLSATSILALKVKIVALFATSASVVSSVRQAIKLLAASSSPVVGMQRSILHAGAILSASVVAARRAITAARSAAAAAVVSMARGVVLTLSVTGASAVAFVRSIARTLSLSALAASLVTSRKSVAHALQFAAGSVVSTFHAAVTKLVLTISTTSVVTLSRRAGAIRSVTSQASVTVIRRAGRVIGLVAASAPSIQRAVFRSLMLTAGARVAAGLVSSIKETVNRYLRVVGRITQYLITGMSDVMVKGATPSTIIGSTTMNTHEPLDFLCGMDWQLGGPQLNADGTPLGLSGATVQWKLDSLDGSTNYLTLTDANGITVNLTTSSVSIDVPGATTSGLSPGTYRDYLIVTLPAGQKIPMWTGIIRAAAQPA